MQVVVIDDDVDILELVSFCVGLRWPQWAISGALNGQEGLRQVRELGAGLLILDKGLPDMDGLEVLRALRSFSNIPVIVLSAQDRDVEIARFLEEGADDYIVKPFSYVEMLGRIQAVLRRSLGSTGPAHPPLQSGDLLMDFAAAEVYKGGKIVGLTRMELGILEQLTKNAPRVVTCKSLSAELLDANVLDLENARLLRVHVGNLRAKLGDPAIEPKYIYNVRGIGYKFLLPVNAVGEPPQPEAEASRLTDPPLILLC